MKQAENHQTEEYVWYVSYGSNMLYDRFMHYIRGGAFEAGGTEHKPCADTSAPLAVKTFEIPYDMYFGNVSRSWGGKGVSFIDITKPGKAKGVAYLITRGQFEHVACQENGGSQPEDNPSWYNAVVSIGELDGHEAVTITNDCIRPYNQPAESYLETLQRGLKENYPSLSAEDIQNYLKECQKCHCISSETT